MPSKAKRNGSVQAQVITAQPCENDIRCRVHEIYIARGEHPGREVDDWLQAEQELTAFAAQSTRTASK